jgi:hypothetical protein
MGKYREHPPLGSSDHYLQVKRLHVGNTFHVCSRNERERGRERERERDLISVG